MKKISLTFFITLLMSAAFAQQVAMNSQKISTLQGDNASFNWSETSFDFRKIKQGKPVTHEFTFVNRGSEALVISSVQVSCGCTVAEYSRVPIAPGQKGFVKATYNAARMGTFAKSITINANTADNIVLLNINGEVVE